MIAEVNPEAVTEAEAAVVGALLLDGRSVDVVLESGLRAEHFYRENLGVIYGAAVTIQRGGAFVDTVTVGDELERQGVLDRIGGRAALYALWERSPTATNAVGYAQIVMRAALKRALAQLSDEARRRSVDPLADGEELLRWMQERIFALGEDSEGRQGLVSALDAVTEAMAEFALRLDGKQLGLDLGMRDLDRTLLGLRPQEVYVIAGRPGMGKSAIATQAALEVARGGVPVAIWSLEMSISVVAQRLLCQEGRIDSTRVNLALVSENEQERLNHAAGVVGDLPMLIAAPPQVTDVELRDSARRAKARYGIGLVVVDYLQLMHVHGGGGLNEVARVSRVSAQLKSMARELDIPVIAVSQLSRGPEQRPDKRPNLSDLRESGAIEQDAAAVMLLYRDEYYNREKTDRPGEMEINVAKNRHGQQRVVRMQWSGQYTRVEDLSGRHADWEVED